MCLQMLEEVELKIISAPPGSGKTRRLVAEIEGRIREGVSPYTIIATTFARESAKEIARRLGGEVSIRTNHGLGYWLVRLARQARGEAVPRVISEARSISIIERAIRELDLKFIEPKQVMDDLANVRERGGKVEALHPLSRQVAARYTAILAAENLLDFVGILEEARKELADPELKEFLRGQRVFVDEGQDINPRTEWPVLDMLREVADEFVVFSSPSQQIYGFRGACWKALCMSLPDGVKMETMKENHRSTPEIVMASWEDRSASGSMRGSPQTRSPYWRAFIPCSTPSRWRCERGISPSGWLGQGEAFFSERRPGQFLATCKWRWTRWTTARSSRSLISLPAGSV
jgi:superfamily I DNA/RNA helicase